MAPSDDGEASKFLRVAYFGDEVRVDSSDVGVQCEPYVVPSAPCVLHDSGATSAPGGADEVAVASVDGSGDCSRVAHGESDAPCGKVASVEFRKTDRGISGISGIRGHLCDEVPHRSQQVERRSGAVSEVHVPTSPRECKECQGVISDVQSPASPSIGQEGQADLDIETLSNIKILGGSDIKIPVQNQFCPAGGRERAYSLACQTSGQEDRQNVSIVDN